MKRVIITIVALLVVALTATGCQTASKSQVSGQKQTEQAFAQQSQAVPYPTDELRDSLERRNLRERLLRTNKPNAISYLYLMSFGKPLGYYTIKGKVTSTGSQMTTSQLAVKMCDSCDRLVMDGPSDNGSYGPDEPGIFFFTTEGAMVTTNLDYVVSDQPIPFDVPKLNHEKDSND